VALLSVIFRTRLILQHASEIDSHHRGKNADVMESHMTRDRIDVEVGVPWQTPGGS
jgi:hypothetical protein